MKFNAVSSHVKHNKRPDLFLCQYDSILEIPKKQTLRALPSTDDVMGNQTEIHALHCGRLIDAQHSND